MMDGVLSSAPSPLAQTALELCTRVSEVKLPSERLPCPTCLKKVLHYCGDCLQPVADELRVPRVTLPLTLDVLRGVEESANKSTASHAPLLATPVRMFVLPDFPKYTDPRRVLILYPSPTSVTVSALPDLSAYDTLAVVDTTWVKVGRVFQSPELAQPFTHVRLGEYNTLFWRHQPLGPHCVSSIESVYYFFREWEIERVRRSTPVPTPLPSLASLYDGRYDDLLLLFLAQYHKIAAEYGKGDSRDVAARIASQLSSSAPQSAGMKARREAEGGLLGGGRLVEDTRKESSNEHTRKRPRVKGAWSVAPSVLGQAAAPMAGVGARQEYVSQHMRALVAGVGGEGQGGVEGAGSVSGAVAAAMQFEHIRVTNRHAYGTHSRPDKESGAQAKAAVEAVWHAHAGAGE